ncbi:MAG TPA: mechanosensitive ion channel family protein [Thermoplasmata archaeon]|nr:mechanosensitive ion channel family protein [Thermoplasmata archaeon]
MLVVPSYDSLLLVTGLALAFSVAAWVIPSRAIRATRWKESTRTTILSVFRGPVLACVFAGALFSIDELFWAANSGNLPALVAPDSVTVILELGILWAFVAASSLAVRRHLLSSEERSGRFLQYGIYAGGLLAVIIILLSSPVVPRVTAGIWATLGFGAGLLVTYLTVHIVNLLAQRYFAVLARDQPHLETIYRFVRRATVGVIALLGVTVSTYVNFPAAAAGVTSLLLAAGFLSIVVGLAAQSTLSNVIAGAMISLAQPFALGDAVVFTGPSGAEWCYVEDIQLTFTVLRTWDLRRLMVPNSMFQSNVVINYTAVDPTMLVVVSIEITYESDVDRARSLMVEEARKHPDFVALGNLPVTHVMSYGDNGVQLRLLSAAKDQPTAFQVEKDLLYSIRKRYTEVGIQLPYPTRRVIVERSSSASPTRGPAALSRGPRKRPSTGS